MSSPSHRRGSLRSEPDALTRLPLVGLGTAAADHSRQPEGIARPEVASAASSTISLPDPGERESGNMTDDHTPDDPTTLPQPRADQSGQPATSDVDDGNTKPDLPVAEVTTSQWRALGTIAMLVLLGFQIALLVAVLDTRNDISELRNEISTIGAVAPNTLGTGQSSPGPSLPVATGNLPRFDGAEVDPAVGRNIGVITGLEYYSGANTRLAGADGKSRAFMVWAHWCPYCQEELPLLADWQTTSAAEFANFELVSVTTSIDETASNPLIPYLDSNDFPFPVLVDEDGSLARKFGVNAFPFWVFVAPDGTVVGRAAGAIDAGNLEDVFSQLNDMASDGPAALSARS
jgi:thiol-disulfide isomerase/thioredoxin